MKGVNYYILTALPGLGDLGGSPPLLPQEMLELVEPNPSATALIQAVFLEDDLIQRQAWHNKAIKEFYLSVLTREQLRDEEPLPEYLMSLEEQTLRKAPEDVLWESYYRYAQQQARRYRSAALQEWIRYEVGLRNAIAVARAKSLELEASDYLVAPELSEDLDEYEQLVQEWIAAANPMLGLRVLDHARWQWLSEHHKWFSFETDELVVYAIKLMILQRWYRLGQAESAGETSEKAQQSQV